WLRPRHRTWGCCRRYKRAPIPSALIRPGSAADNRSQRMGKTAGLGCAAVVLVLLLIGGTTIGGSYNSLVQLDQAPQAQWAQVQNAYQRRADLVPNLVATVKGAANFEKSTMVEVTEARARVNQISPAAMQDVLRDPAAFQRFQQAQAGLSQALSHLFA